MDGTRPRTPSPATARIAHCPRLAVHAEQAALLIAGLDARGAHLLHVKVKDGVAVTSGPPSCVECSKLILHAGIAVVWLYEEREGAPQLVGYPAADFHAASLAHDGLPRIA